MSSFFAPHPISNGGMFWLLVLVAATSFCLTVWQFRGRSNPDKEDIPHFWRRFWIVEGCCALLGGLVGLYAKDWMTALSAVLLAVGVVPVAISYVRGDLMRF